MSEDKDDLFKRLSDDELRAAGIDTSNIIWQPDDEPKGPYRLYRTGLIPCPKCGDLQHLFRLSIINLETGKVIEDSWNHADRWVANLQCLVMNDGWVSGLSAIRQEHRERVRHRTPRSTNAFLDEPLSLDMSESQVCSGVHFTERDYGNQMVIGLMFRDGKRSAILAQPDDAVRLAKAILARWPEPIEDAVPAPPPNET